jgi:hypothetical protein
VVFGEECRKSALKEAIESATQRLGDTQSRPLLVCIDQFEELFVTVKDQVRRQFFMALKEAVEEGKLRLILAVRKDFADLVVDARRDVDPDNTAFAFDRDSYYTLRSFSEEQAEAVLLRVLDHEEIHGSDPLTKQEQSDFARVLVQVLLRPPLDKRLSAEDEQRVLPVELQMVGWTYESILERRFSAAEFRRLGGKAGLYRHYIEDAKEYVFRKTGIPGATSLRVLRLLISPAGTRWEQSVAAIMREAGLSAKQVAQVLEAFKERSLVRPIPSEQPGPGEEGPTCGYELMHEHLVQLLEEAPQKELQRLRNAEAGLRSWRERTRNLFEPQSDIAPQPGRSRLRAFGAWLASFFAQPIPIGETLRLWRYTRDPEDRRMLRRNLRGFLATLLAVSVLIGVSWAGWFYYERTPSNQLRYVIAYAPDKDLARSGLPYESDRWVFNGWLAALVAAGRPDSAMAAAAEVTNPDSQSRAFVAVAEAAAKADDRVRAAQAFDAAMAAAAKVNYPYNHSGPYEAIAEAAANNGLIDAVLRAAAEVTNPDSQSLAHAGIAAAAARSGLIEAALTVAAKVTRPDYQSRAYMAIAEAAAKAHDRDHATQAFDAALGAAARVTFPDYQSRAYMAIVAAAIKAHDRDHATQAFDAALGAAAKVTDPNVQSQAYMVIAEAAAKAHDRDRVAYSMNAALGAASKATDPYYQSQAYAAIAEAAAKAGRLDVALDAASKATDRDVQSRAYAAIVEATAKAGQLDAALGAASKATSPYYQSQAYAAIAEAAAKAGQFDAALDAASKPTDLYCQSQAYAAIAEAAAKAGQFDTALGAASKATDPVVQSRAYAVTAEAESSPGADRSKAPLAGAQALAREGFFYKARIYCEPWERIDKLRAYTTILEEYTKRYPPSVKKANP